MSKLVFAMILGGVLGIFDGLSALLSAPETQPMIATIVAGSTVKGVIVGALIGWYAKKRPTAGKAVFFGLLAGAFFAFLIAMMPNPDGSHYWWQIILPGSLLGAIVGYAAQRWEGKRAMAR